MPRASLIKMKLLIPIIVESNILRGHKMPI